MKKKILAGFITAMVLSGAALAGDKVNIEFAGNTERMDVGSLKSTGVCALKQRVAAKLGLKIKKFDIKKKHNATLRTGKTLYDAGVRNHNALTVHEVHHSTQC